MSTFKSGVVIDIDDNESVIDRIEENITPHELSLSDLSEKSKMILFDNRDLEK